MKLFDFIFRKGKKSVSAVVDTRTPFEGRAHVKVPFGKKVYFVYPGPYYNRPPAMLGVKMAAEISDPCDVSVPTKDFTVPDEKLVRAGLISALVLAYEDEEFYVGCMGGVGRTGFFLALLVKLSEEMGFNPYEDSWTEDPNSNVPKCVQYIRYKCNPNMVETQHQLIAIQNFDLTDIVLALRATGMFN